MTSIHITELQQILLERQRANPTPNQNKGEGFFLEIRFDDPNSTTTGMVDEEYKNRIITVDCPYGTVTIQFDEYGQLESLDLS